MLLRTWQYLGLEVVTIVNVMQASNFKRYFGLYRERHVDALRKDRWYTHYLGDCVWCGTLKGDCSRRNLATYTALSASIYVIFG